MVPTDNKDRYTARLKVGEVEFEVSGDKDFVDRYIAEWKENLMQNVDLKKPLRDGDQKISLDKHDRLMTDLVEFYASKDPQTQNEAIAVFGYYFENKDSKKEFSSKDLLQAFDNVRIARPKNIHDTLKKCYKRTGYILPVIGNKKGFWRLSSKGIELVGKLPTKKGE